MLLQVCKDFAHDSDLIRDEIISKIIHPQCVRVISRGDDDRSKEFKIWNIFSDDNLTMPNLRLRGRVKVKTFFTGFWDPSSRTHSFELFEAAGRECMIDELNRVLHPIYVKNVSDSGKSFAHVLSVYIPARP